MQLFIHFNACFTCGKDKGKNKKYCSSTCTGIGQRSSRENINCIRCEKKLENWQKKFCSKSCSASVNNIGVQRVFATCVMCDNKVPDARVLCCSKECQERITGIYKEFDWRNVDSKERYYIRLRLQTPYDADLDAIDEFYRNRPVGYEVDHIIPISKGGLHSIENLQYLTPHENKVKSNKLA